MPKYIDADNMKTILEERRDTVTRLYGDLGGAVSGCIKLLDQQPAADVATVVRCKDCKYKPTAPAGITYGLRVEFPDKWANRCPCLCKDGWYSWVPDDDFFCAYGAKMDEEETDGEL